MVKRKAITYLGIIIIIIDQLTKYLAKSNLDLHQSIPIIKDFFHITLTTNTGIGFGLLRDNNALISFITIIILGSILFYYDELPKKGKAHLSIVMIISGALSNLMDRIFLGHIVDFIDFRVWPIFNIADACITLGILYMFFYYSKKK
ncbi:signal peptidase II [Candidatus Woesearchaeota archaeon]|jgi:signal peptidase II|nr:signal peptidase II [Candidatus Woesearchaeota archaeon]